jgi:micrococcal nuclease
MRTPWNLALAALAGLPFLLPLAPWTGVIAPTRAAAQQPAAGATLAAPAPAIAGAAAVCAITRVVDGDTVWVKRAGVEEKLRLLCVDTEETIKKGPSDPGKPQTVFGDDTAHWAKDLFGGLAGADGLTYIGLKFPGGHEQRDSYGRLLCHVLLPDGSDFNLRLVREGWSPYFNKYGNSELAHTDFVAAQQEAREKRIGIWSPAVNRPQTSGTPSAKRHYDDLLPWWDARAEAIGAFRVRKANGEEGLYDGEDPEAIQLALEWCKRTNKEATLFGSFEGIHAEGDGTRSIVFRGPDKKRMLRALVTQAAWPNLAGLALDARANEMVQNYVYVTGKLETHERGGAALLADRVEQWKIAAPEYRAKLAQPAEAKAEAKAPASR